jgi:hypothetical protein
MRFSLIPLILASAALASPIHHNDPVSAEQSRALAEAPDAVMQRSPIPPPIRHGAAPEPAGPPKTPPAKNPTKPGTKPKNKGKPDPPVRLNSCRKNGIDDDLDMWL